MSNTFYIIVLVVCVVLSALFSGAEIAYAKVNQLKLKRAAERKECNAKLALSLSENYTNTLSTILIGNNLVNIAASAVATLLFENLFVGTFFEGNTELWTTIIMTLIILTFGEILPKTISASYNYGFSKFYSWPIVVFKVILFPLTYLVNKMAKGIEKAFTKKENVTDEELIEMVDSMEEQGVIDEDTQELITNAIDFVDVDAVEIMVHRTDVFAYDIEDDINELISNPRLLNYSRIPVYEGTIDNVIGILNTKQLIKLHLNGDKIDVRELLTEPLYVFQTQSVSVVLKELRNKHIHMAIVKDEYGGNMGILTLEDILEELVGEIYDEKDEEELEEYHKVNKNKFTVDGDMNIYDFFDLIDYDYEEYDGIYTTVGGWITGVLEKFPEEKDSFDFEGYIITVLRATKYTVERVSVTKKEIEEE